VRGPLSTATLERVQEIVGRAPTLSYEEDGSAVLEFDPPLTTEERALLARAVRLARVRVPGITPEEWVALEPALEALRTFRSRSDAQLAAMTAAQRDAALTAGLRGVIDVLRAIFRDD
jgi:hypothetical protein